jgi:hypothetical protein
MNQFYFGDNLQLLRLRISVTKPAQTNRHRVVA